MAGRISADVLIPVRNEERYLRRSVESVLSQDFDGTLNILLIVGPSRDSSHDIARDLAREFDSVSILENPDGRTTVGLNKAIESTSSEFVVRVDAHVEIQSDYIATGIDLLTRRSADLVGGIMSAVGQTPFQSATAWAYNSRAGLGGGPHHVGGDERVAETAYLGIFRRTSLERVGGYDTEVIRGEDWDIAQRVKASGGLVWFSPALVSRYWPRSHARDLVRQFFATGVWRGYLTRREPRAADFRYFVPPLMIAVVILGLVAAAFGWLIGVIPVIVYVLGVCFVALLAKGLAAKTRVSAPIVLAIMHFSWGAGFWRGVLFGAANTVDRSRVSR